MIPIETTLKAAQVAEELEYLKWDKEIPFIPFPASWEVAPRPNFGGAIVRFKVRKKGSEYYISVYLDCYDSLGCYGSPYWEIYPAYDGDIERFDIKDVEGLVKGLKKSMRMLR